MVNNIRNQLVVLKSMGLDTLYVLPSIKQLLNASHNTAKDKIFADNIANDANREKVKQQSQEILNSAFNKHEPKIKIPPTNAVNKSDVVQKVNNGFNYTPLYKAKTLDDIKSILSTFNNCGLKETAINTVFGDGGFSKKLMIIGEAPGSEEDEQGVPFVGRSGVMLTKALQCVGIARKDCFITNRVFWRPPGNRTPTELEIEQCTPFINQIIEVLQPKLILLVGKVATTNLLPNDAITKLIGKFFDININNTLCKARAVYHPSYLLRSPSKKIFLWHDVLDVKHFLN